jgi:uncharacterized Zn-finger protein
MIGRSDLPVTCPPAAEWNKHPRVCIPFPDGAAESICPYCGNRFIIKDEDGKESEKKEGG